MKPLRFFILCCPSETGRDRWLVGWSNSTRLAWNAPRWLTYKSRRYAVSK